MRAAVRPGAAEERRRPARRGRRPKLGWLCVLFLLAALWITRVEVLDVPPPFAPAPPPPAAELEREDRPPVEAPADGGSGAAARQSRAPRYAGIELSVEERRELAAVIFLEAATQSLRGQQAIAEVVFNRVTADNFPNTVHEVLTQGVDGALPQFSTAPYLEDAAPTACQYLAIELALSGPSILPADVVYFSRDGENEYVWGSIEDHVFCYQYPWAGV